VTESGIHRQRTEQEAALGILRRGRERLIEDVLEYKRPDVYSWLFKHEENPHGRRMVFDMYFVEWINIQLRDAFNLSSALGAAMTRHLCSLIEERAAIERKSAVLVNAMIPDLLDEKIKVLRVFMRVENINEARLNKLYFWQEQDNAVYNRKLKEILEKSTTSQGATSEFT
jgi:hypothetical protein